MYLSHQGTEPHSTLFCDSFCNSAFETVIMNDPVADDNLMPPYVLDRIVDADPDLKVEELPK